MLDPDVLNVDTSDASRREQPRQFTWLVADDRLDGRVHRRRTTPLAGNSGHAITAGLKEGGQLLGRVCLPSRNIGKYLAGRGQLARDGQQYRTNRNRVGDQDLGP